MAHLTFKVLGINHLGIAAKHPDKARNFLGTLLGLPLLGEELVAEQKTNTIMFSADTTQKYPSRLELLEPSDKDPESPINKFLTTRGGGIHHVALTVDHLDVAIRELTALGVDFIDRTPRRGAHNTKIAFIHPRATGGILVELVEEQIQGQSPLGA